MTSTRTRSPLTRDRIIDAAVILADSGGVEELSMRKLGAELGVEAMSLYNHVQKKDDILDGMIDHVFRAIPLPRRRLRLALSRSVRRLWPPSTSSSSTRGWSTC